MTTQSIVTRLVTGWANAYRDPDGNYCSTRCYGDAAVQIIQGLRDDALRRREVSDGLDGFPPSTEFILCEVALGLGSLPQTPPVA